MKPTLDAEASAALASELETLARLPRQQAIHEPRWRLSTSALEHLWSVRGRGLLGGRSRNSAEGRELRAAGLVNGFGAPTAEGSAITGFLSGADFVVQAAATHGGRTHAWGYWARGSEGLTRSSEPVGAEPSDEKVRLDLLPEGLAVGRLVEWLGLAPAWAFGGDAFDVADEILDGRISLPGQAAGAAPIDHPAFARAWSRPTWTQLEGYCAQTNHGFRVVVAGDGGAFERTKTSITGVSRLLPVATETVFRQVVGLFSDEGSAPWA